MTVYARSFPETGPRWFTIASHRPFLDDLAAGLISRLAPAGELALSDAIVLMPTRRAARELASAFLRTAAGPAMLLPQIRTLGDLEADEPPFESGAIALELPPAISSLRRRFELARLAAAHEGFERRLDAGAALAMADALGAFLDGLYLEERFDPEAVEGLVTGELARHWRLSADLLALATRVWPERLKELGLIDASDRRVRLLKALAWQWRERPPERPLIAAGSTGSTPATAELLDVIARAPAGAVVLPGLDLSLDAAAWDCLDDQHPQKTMKALLEGAGVTRGQVRRWSGEKSAGAGRATARTRIVAEALRPAEVTDDWIQRIAELKAGAEADADPVAEGLEGLSILRPRNEVEAAACAALLLRETLETPGRTAALVTPDVALARRVQAQLGRWGLEVDSSSGAALSALPAGVLAGLVAALAAAPRDPVLWLSILKHPLTRLGRARQDLTSALRALERRGLRGTRPKDDAALAVRLKDEAAAQALAADLAAVADALAAAFAVETTSTPDATAALARACERLTTDETGAVAGLWSGADGEALAALMASLMDEGESLPPVSADAFGELVALLLGETTVRVSRAAHPRIRILGALEARLVGADRVILAGLEEGVWPRPPGIDPFLSRSMRKALGLPAPERRVGLSAHDFAQSASAPEVAMIACQRRGGQPAVPSRWLWRLQTLARGAGVAIDSGDATLALARAIDAPLDPRPPELEAAERPEPTPPLALRPRELPVTQVETWVRDPYALYARKILRLKPMDPPDAPVDARLRGTAVHQAFERFTGLAAVGETADAATFEALLLEALETAGMSGAALARERLLAARIAPWAAAFEQRRRQGAAVWAETPGSLTFDSEGGGGPFTITARPDRLELDENRVHVLDYKTGAAPSLSQMSAGLSPQLTLTAAIAHGGGFEAMGRPEVGELIYVRVTGRTPPACEETRGKPGETPAMAAVALEGLKRRVARFDDEEEPYRSREAMQFIGRGGDFDHLARVYEWAVAGADSANEGAAA